MTYKEAICSRRGLFFVMMAIFAIVGVLSALPADYATKGEPREALVAIEMMRAGDMILPVDGAGDMSYKPPLFHWLIVLFSLPAGHVSEFTSRLPSVLAMLLMMGALWSYRRSGRREDENGTVGALLACLMCFTSYEVFRAAENCRVDMLLSALMACGSICLYKGGSLGFSSGWSRHLVGVLCLSGAVLTKGPVGAMLPIALWWVWSMICNFGRKTPVQLLLITLWAGLLLVLSLILPALWYLAAYERGGDRFLALAMEENFGRLTGTMTYGSHLKPFWYNFVMLAAGLLPWSAMLLASLAWKPWKRLKSTSRKPRSERRMYSLVMVIGVLVFYTIPASKRSVYLLPLYPFAASLMADYALALGRSMPRLVPRLTRCAWAFVALYLAGYTLIWPAIVNHKSDRHVAAQIEQIAGQAPIYTFINSRMDRFYGVDFYLGTRLQSLLPSGQVTPMPAGGYTAAMARVPADTLSYVCLTLRDSEEQGEALRIRFGSAGVTLIKVFTSRRPTRDMGQPIVLYKACKKQP